MPTYTIRADLEALVLFRRYSADNAPRALDEADADLQERLKHLAELGWENNAGQPLLTVVGPADEEEESL